MADESWIRLLMAEPDAGHPRSPVTADELEFLGKFRAWLEQAPSLEVPYGDFYVERVQVVFSGEPLGEFYADGEVWLFKDKEFE